MPFKRLDRRTFLRSSGVAVALPFLDAMLPVGTAAASAKSESPRRLVLVGLPLGMYAPNFFPDKAGRDYEPSRYLKVLLPHREHFTVFSGMSHRYAPGHHSQSALMSGVPAEWIRSPTDIRNGVSLDQEVAARIGGHTRFASLVLGESYASWNHRGVAVPAQRSAMQAFRELFVKGTPQEEARQLRRFQEGQSILDDVRAQMKALNNKLGKVDRERIDLYLSSVREAEQRLQQDERWSKTPKPKVDYKPPINDFIGVQLVAHSQQWYDIVHLALQTDSTRVVSLHLTSYRPPDIEGVTLAPHDASHHGQDPAKLDQLALIEEAEIRVFGEFLDKLKKSSEGENALLDRTAVFFASNLGNSSSHACDNLPIILAGGGFKHQGHIAFDRKNNKLLSNLFVRMLHQLGIEAKAFGASNGTISEV
jgi:hypothetical protein